jgi:hypothetical protein
MCELKLSARIVLTLHSLRSANLLGFHIPRISCLFLQHPHIQLQILGPLLPKNQIRHHLVGRVDLVALHTMRTRIRACETAQLQRVREEMSLGAPQSCLEEVVQIDHSLQPKGCHQNPAKVVVVVAVKADSQEKSAVHQDIQVAGLHMLDVQLEMRNHHLCTKEEHQQMAQALCPTGRTYFLEYFENTKLDLMAGTQLSLATPIGKKR